MIENALDTVPPKELLTDDLIGTFGNREQELAVKVIVRKAVESRTWRVTFSADDFEPSKSSLEIEGFSDLITNRWIVPSQIIDRWQPTTDLVNRLMNKRPYAFLPDERRVEDRRIQDQPPPVVNQNPAVWDLVVEDMKDRDRLGEERYGTRLRAMNGRDALIDLYQELLDAVVYLRQVIEEKDTPIPMLLRCPNCHEPHIDQAEGDWTNPPHRTHLCAGCKRTWQPALVNTTGVLTLIGD